MPEESCCHGPFQQGDLHARAIIENKTRDLSVCSQPPRRLGHTMTAPPATDGAFALSEEQKAKVLKQVWS